MKREEGKTEDSALPKSGAGVWAATDNLTIGLSNAVLTYDTLRNCADVDQASIVTALFISAPFGRKRERRPARERSRLHEAGYDDNHQLGMIKVAHRRTRAKFEADGIGDETFAIQLNQTQLAAEILISPPSPSFLWDLAKQPGDSASKRQVSW